MNETATEPDEAKPQIHGLKSTKRRHPLKPVSASKNVITVNNETESHSHY